MSYIHSDKSRENDEHALPNIEVFYAREGELTGEEGEELSAGWYWWPCFPGCMPDGEPNGPFGTEALAIEDAQEDND